MQTAGSTTRNLTEGLERLRHASHDNGEMLEVVLSWYRTGGDIDHVYAAHPDISRVMIDEIIDAYRPVRTVIETMYLAWISATAPQAEREARMDAWVALTGMPDLRW